MLRWVRSFKTFPDKRHEAVQYAKEIATFLNGNEAFPVSNVQVFIQAFGEPGTIIMTADLENFAAFDSLVARGDPDWQQVLTKGNALTVPGSVQDTVLFCLT